MAVDYIVPMGHDDGVRIASALEALAGRAVLSWDEAAGRYSDASVASMLAARRDGLAYGVSVPKGSSVACTKFGANAGVPVPTPGVVGRPAQDPYAGLGPFFHVDVNGYVDPDGSPHVTAVEGDGRFRRDGSNGNVWVLAPVLWWLMDSSGADAVTISVSDTRLAGMSAQPQAYLPDGTLRPFMLYAKYAGSKGDDGMMASVSGRRPWNRTTSHNTLITQCATATTGYSGRSVADDWYVKVMLLLKYATKNSQSVFAGCTSYTTQCAPTVAETGVTRVVVSNANAANVDVGSALMLGTHTATSSDRNMGYNYDVFDGLRVLRKEAYDANNTAIYLDSATTFDVATTCLLSTSPWHSGSLDAVEGDGTVTDAGRANGHEPFKLQGIECMVGMYEVMGDVALKSVGSGWQVYVNRDSRREATSVTSDYEATGRYLPSAASDGWQYPLYPEDMGGMLLGSTTVASQTTGLCDGHYVNKASTTGERELLVFGLLDSGGSAGVWCCHGSNALGNANWSIGSRLSASGRSA